MRMSGDADAAIVHLQDSLKVEGKVFAPADTLVTLRSFDKRCSRSNRI